MKRVNSLPEAGALGFIDSSGNMDRQGLRVFLLMMTWTAAGGLPLGIIITSWAGRASDFPGLLREVFPWASLSQAGQAGPQNLPLDDMDRCRKTSLGRHYHKLDRQGLRIFLLMT